jgi:16S rRNA (guanine527-N7)-methyltransferase
MDPTQINELLAPFLEDEELGQGRLGQVSAYLELLLKWNAKINLTAVRTAEEMVTRHFGESFFAARILLGKGSIRSVIDLGSGAGFPGLPMAIYSPETPVTLIESQNKKATFLKEVMRALDLKNVEVFAGRGEDYPGKAPLVTLRAVERFDQAAKVAAELVEPAGRLAFMVGVGQRESLPEGFTWQAGTRVPGSDSRILAIGTRD